MRRLPYKNDPKTENRTELVRFMNMCMVENGRGDVLALDKVDDSYSGTTFPGGHVERGESFHDSMIREVWEETGLSIKNPVLCGVYHWTKEGIHNVVFLYKADEYTGTLQSSDEGEVYWISKEEFRKKELATGMERVLEIIESGDKRECFMYPKEEGYVGALY